MANILDKLVDVKYKALFHLRIDSASPPVINPELLFGAYIQLTVPTGGTNFTVGERVTQGTGGTLSSGRVAVIVGDTIIKVSTDNDSVAVFDTSVAVVGETSGASKTPSAYAVITPLTLGITKLAWVNNLGSAEAIELAWDATVDERIVSLTTGSGKLEMPGVVLKPGVITGQTGSITPINIGTIAAPDLASILIEVEKITGFYYYER